MSLGSNLTTKDLRLIKELGEAKKAKQENKILNEIETIKKAIEKDFPELIGEDIHGIGEGSYARVYRAGNKAFKVTGDLHDAIMSKRVMGQELEHFAEVFKVYVSKIYSRKHTETGELAFRGGMGHVKKYIIVTEFLETEKFHEFNTIEYFSHPFHKYVNNILKYGEEFYIDRGHDPRKFHSFKDDDVSDEFIEQMKSLAHEAAEVGFRSIDFHEKNFRMSNGVIKMFDLGHRTSDKSEEIFEEL